MALIVEDGSLPVDAVSYVTVAELRAFADARGSTLSEDDTLLEKALILAADYIEGFSDRFKGSKVDEEQSLQFPRSGLYVDGFLISETVIHKSLKNAQCQLAIESAGGTDLQPTGDGREIIKEKLDVLETEWKPGAGGSPQPVFSKAMKFLAPLLKGGGGLSLVRA